MAKRKIIQITSAGVEHVGTTQCNYIIACLCDDGTVWRIRDTVIEWKRLPEIPQEEIHENKK